jgi:surfeit locus 1 family protein
MTMRIGPFSFAPGIVTTAAAAGTFALLAWLGTWQLDRAREKTQRQALFDARLAEAPLQLTGAASSAGPLLYRRVRARGEWIAQGQVFIDNRIHSGRAGFHVITPLRLEGARESVLVNRGWIARGADYPRPPQVAVPAGPMQVSGIATVPPARVLELSNETISGNVWQNLSVERYRARTGIDVLPVVVLAEQAAPGLAPVRETPDAGVAKHQEYALTWFSLAATVLVLWIALNLRRAR